MHGVRRNKFQSKLEIEEEEKRSNSLADLTRKALILRRQKILNVQDPQFASSYQTVENALETNPDEYSLWAFRREVFIEFCSNPSDNSIDELWQKELNLTIRALKRHPKAYPAWQQRLWLLQSDHVTKHVSSDKLHLVRKQEQMISAAMLAKDGRNFHGWAHRMRTKAVIPCHQENQTEIDKKELDFITTKINDDFANYSAWHHRSVYLLKLNHDSNTFINDELNFVTHALYTEPDVQSAWFYYRWLLSGAPSRGNKPTYNQDRLIEQLSACNELLFIEPDAVGALQTKTLILIQLRRGNEAIPVIDDLCRVVSDLIEPKYVCIYKISKEFRSPNFISIIALIRIPCEKGFMNTCEKKHSLQVSPRNM